MAEGWSCCGGAEDGKIRGVADGGRLKEKALGGVEGAVAAGLWLISLTAAARGRTEAVGFWQREGKLDLEAAGGSGKGNGE